MKLSTSSIVLLSGIASIGIASAQVNGTQLQNLLSLVQSLVNQAVPLLIAIAVLSFFYGLVMFIWKGKEGGETLEKSKQFMMYSIGALFVMVSIWGIITALQNIFGITGVDHIIYPKV
jgi:hypothetical protein